MRAVVTEPDQRCGAMETASGHDVITPRNSINVITRTDGYLASSVTMETGRGGPSCPWHIQVTTTPHLMRIALMMGRRNRFIVSSD